MGTLKIFGAETDRIINCDDKFKQELVEKDLIHYDPTPNKWTYFETETHLVLEVIRDEVAEKPIPQDSWLGMTLQEIIDGYKDGDDEALDGDSVDILSNIIKAKINLQEGNITHEEYLKLYF